jgi:hypothetical protein
MTHTATMTSEPPQRIRALEKANEVRLARAELKRRIAQGNLCAARIILDSPSEASSWAVGDLLTSQRRWGSQRSRKFLSRLQISERREIGKLTERQRRALAAALLAHSAHGWEVEPLQPMTVVDAPAALETLGARELVTA